MIAEYTSEIQKKEGELASKQQEILRLTEITNRKEQEAHLLKEKIDKLTFTCQKQKEKM